MLPALDLATIFVANSVIAGVTALVLTVIRRHQPDISGIGPWAAGQAAYFTGFLLLYLSMMKTIQPTAMPGFFFCFAGALLTSLGFHRFLGLSRWATRAAVGAFLAMLVLLPLLSLTGRAGLIIAVTIAVLGGTSGLNAWLLYRNGKGQVRPAALTLAALHGCWSLYAVARLVYIAANGFGRPAAIATLAPAMLVGTLMLTCHALGLVWLVVGRLQEHLVRQAATDPLTGALNRRALLARLDQERARAARDGTGFALATFDLDHFKQLNDTHGHVVGDATLVGVVETARRLLRPDDAVARLGGEEFCLLLPNATGHEALALAEQIRQEMARLSIDSPAGPVTVAASFGVAWYGTHGRDWPSLLKAADGALYCAKRQGRNQVVAAA
ncbi:GGDEF domain-containing protein [Niveispirillum sp.]|uniref:GGDEF domain-containing protein n=1 Tax=Niveispirillum sp. TaxID=1917217 RepID=UPI001B5D35DE|nr:GGDEF domain-containing protein [Niveispirillum sp.]MBP7334479.1 GGDEF domain-containing protein [Niveispirillum sp.]